MNIYASKQYHGGFNWGWWIQKPNAQDSRIHRSNYEPCYDISATDGTRHLFKFGNEWIAKPGTEFYGKPFQHPNTIPHNNWHFWDNPELPQFLWSRAHNPGGNKDWCRWTPGDVFSTEHNTHPGDDKRINRLLTTLSGKKNFSWIDLIDPQPIRAGDSRTILLCPVSAPNYTHYYNTTQTEWIAQWTQWAEGLGYTVEVRVKPGRTQRRAWELTDQLREGNYTATLSQHSASALESVVAGTPAIVTGPNPAGPLATTTQQFEAGSVEEAHPDDALEWYARVLSNTRHKSELVEHGI